MTAPETPLVGPYVPEGCAHRYGCAQPASAHPESTYRMDGYPPDAPTHTFEPRAPRPYDHERVEAHIETQWTCHACKAANDVWGIARDEYMDCPSCGAKSWLS